MNKFDKKWKQLVEGLDRKRFDYKSKAQLKRMTPEEREEYQAAKKKHRDSLPEPVKARVRKSIEKYRRQYNPTDEEARADVEADIKRVDAEVDARMEQFFKVRERYEKVEQNIKVLNDKRKKDPNNKEIAKLQQKNILELATLEKKMKEIIGSRKK
jgi:hypothetical protein